MNDDSEIIITGDPALLMLTSYVIRQLENICGINLPHLFDYPRYFRVIRIFVERGNVDEVKRISRDMDDYMLDEYYY